VVDALGRSLGFKADTRPDETSSGADVSRGKTLFESFAVNGI